MRQTQKLTCRWTRLTALLLALALLLAGCAAPSDDSGNLSEADTPLENGATMSFDDLTGSDAAIQDETDETPDKALLTERTGLVEDEFVEISAEEAAAIDRTAAGMQAAYVAGPNGEDPLVKNRDWSIYTSPIGRENLSRREADFYDKLDKCCEKYLRTSGVNGVRHNCSGTVYYALQGINFSSSGLTQKQASSVYCWFRYNHPQYYFLSHVYLIDSSSLYPCIFETMSDAAERAKFTNELFDKLEGWIRQVKESGSTTYERELLTNNLLCVENVYQETYIGNLQADQSLYSSVMMGSTVCAGYAMAFCAMMNAMDIDTTVGLSSNHAWNVVCFDDGNCYAVDVCWNDTDSDPPYKNDFLNVGEKIISVTNGRKEAHTYQKEFATWIPAIAKDSYIPTGADLDVANQIAAPTNCRAVPSETEQGKVILSWDPVPEATVYNACAYTDATYTTIMEGASAEIPADKGTSIRFTKAAAGKTYYLGVRAGKNINGKMVYSDWVNLSYTHPEATAP